MEQVSNVHSAKQQVLVAKNATPVPLHVRALHVALAKLHANSDMLPNWETGFGERIHAMICDGVAKTTFGYNETVRKKSFSIDKRSEPSSSHSAGKLIEKGALILRHVKLIIKYLDGRDSVAKSFALESEQSATNGESHSAAQDTYT